MSLTNLNQNFTLVNDEKFNNVSSFNRLVLPQHKTSDPHGIKGNLAYNSTSNSIMYSNGTEWKTISSSGGLNPGTFTYSDITVDNSGSISSISNGIQPVTSITAGEGIEITGTTSVPIVSSTGINSITTGTGITSTGGTDPTISVSDTFATGGTFTPTFIFNSPSNGTVVLQNESAATYTLVNSIVTCIIGFSMAPSTTTFDLSISVPPGLGITNTDGDQNIHGCANMISNVANSSIALTVRTNIGISGQTDGQYIRISIPDNNTVTSGDNYEVGLSVQWKVK